MSWFGDVAAGVAQGLNLEPPRVAAAIVAAVHSAWITGSAVGTALVADAFAHGQTTPDQLGAYIGSHWLALVLTTLITPAIRANSAYHAATPGGVADQLPPPSIGAKP